MLVSSRRACALLVYSCLSITTIIEVKWRSSSVADDLLEQYKYYLQYIKNFKKRVDVFLYAHISEKNTDVVTLYLKNETLVSLRTVYDVINAMDIDPSSFVVPKELLANCRYKVYAYKFCKRFSYSMLKRFLSSVINYFVDTW